MIELPNKKYNIIYADPPWSYRTWTAKGGHKSASAHYTTLNTQQICELPIQKLGNNAVLFLWATYPNLLDAFKVIDAWGFKYKTVAFTWVKTYKNGNPVIGLGYWTRSNAEICLLATKGNYPRRIDKSVSQIIIEKPREHSRKPDCARTKIVTLIGNLPRIELFARQKVEGWDAWGDEIHD